MAFSTLSIGTTALLTARYGLDITGQNLGNVDTPGYSRQRMIQNAVPGYGTSTAIIGNGVGVKSVKRIGNEFLEKQLRTATCSDVYQGNIKSCYGNLQSYFYELTGHALSDSMNTFWGAMNDFSDNVENIALRTTTISEAESMVQQFNSLGNKLQTYRKDVDGEVQESIKQVNRLLNQIAEYNKYIVQTELGGLSELSANDLRDQRGEAIKELYSLMDIDVVEEKNGSSIISIHGRNLVYYNQVTEVKSDQVMNNGMLVHVPVFANDHYPISPLSGQLAAQMEMRDEIIPSYLDQVDTLAGNFVWQFNRVHSQLRGLSTYDSMTALNAPVDPSVTLDKLTYTDKIPAGTFQIVNGKFEIVVQNRNDNKETTVPIEIDLDGRPGPGGEPDMILWDPDNPDASNSLVNRMQKALDEAFPGTFTVSVDRQYRLNIASSSSEYGFTFANDTSGVLAALGMNVLFTGHNSLTMGINSQVKNDPSLLGGAKSFLKGDNEGAQDLVALQDKNFVSLQGMSLDGYYQGITGRLASEASRATAMKYSTEDILTHMFTQRESVSGVNEDEEVTKMITYQRAFQSAAKFISTVDQLYETLINM